MAPINGLHFSESAPVEPPSSVRPRPLPIRAPNTILPPLPVNPMWSMKSLQCQKYRMSLMVANPCHSSYHAWFSFSVGFSSTGRSWEFEEAPSIAEQPHPFGNQKPTRVTPPWELVFSFCWACMLSSPSLISQLDQWKGMAHLSCHIICSSNTRSYVHFA